MNWFKPNVRKTCVLLLEALDRLDITSPAFGKDNFVNHNALINYWDDNYEKI